MPVPHTSSFRSDLQALRALAIVLVVSMHAGIPFLGGGYIGVDVFFVLSGYLITERILQALRKSGARVVLMAPPPALGFNGLACLSAHQVWPSWLARSHSCAAPQRARVRRVDRWLAQAIRGEPGVRLLVLNQVVCPGHVCRARQGRQIEFRDALHVTAAFAKSRTAQIGRLLQAAGALAGPMS